jgi:hypothetical protein
METEGTRAKEETLPPGFRFHPTDEELITYYLVNKISDSDNFTCKAIGDVDLNKCEPWELPGSYYSYIYLSIIDHHLILNFFFACSFLYQ